MKNFLQNRAVRPYLITYLIWLVFLLFLILNSTTEDGTPYPLGAGIFVAILSAFVFSVPVWVVQFVWMFFRKKTKKHALTVSPVSVKEEKAAPTIAPDDSKTSKQVPHNTQTPIQSQEKPIYDKCDITYNIPSPDHSRTVAIARTEIENAKREANIINTTSEPEVFFPGYRDMLLSLQKLSQYEHDVDFEGRLPSDILAELEGEEKRAAVVHNFIQRYIEGRKGHMLYTAMYNELQPYQDNIPCSDMEALLQEVQKEKSHTAELAKAAAERKARLNEQRHKAQAEEKRQRRAAVQKRIDENLARQEEAKATASAYRESRIQATQGMDRRQLLIDAIRLSSSKMFLSEDTLKREYPCLSDEELHSLLADLQRLGAIQQRSSGNAWLSLLDQQDAKTLIETLQTEGSEDSSEPEAARKMDGHEFEQYCADLLTRNGFTRVEVTKASGDFGIDVLAEKDGVTYAIQCKYYTDKVGNHAVQEAFAGKEYYDRMIAVVMTNSTFTPAAIETARQTHVLLWDGNVLDQMEGAQNQR